MGDDRWYRGALVRRRYRNHEPHGWWMLPEGPLRHHPDKGWVLTLEQARAEIDHHLTDGQCLLRDGDRWVGVLAVSRSADSMTDRAVFRGFSAWCAARHDQSHEPCSTRGCPCDCHSPP